MSAQIDIFQIHKDSLVQSCFTKRINVHHTLLQVLSIIGNYFESIPPLPPGGPLGVRLMCCSLGWDAVGWWGPRLITSRGRQSLRLKHEIDHKWHRSLHLQLWNLNLSLSWSFLSIIGKQSTVPLSFSFSQLWNGWSNEERLSLINILTAMAELFLKPYYSLISSFFPNIVFHISKSKLDTIFTVAWIYSVDVRANACLLTRKAGPREMKDNHRNNLATEHGKGGKIPLRGY